MIRKVKVYFSGASEPINIGGSMAFGFSVHVENRPEAEEIYFEPATDFNSVSEANFASLVYAMAYLIDKKYHQDQVRFYGDDMNTVNIMSGRWKPKGKNIDTILSAQNLLSNFIDVGFTTIDKSENQTLRKKMSEQFAKEGIPERPKIKEAKPSVKEKV